MPRWTVEEHDPRRLDAFLMRSLELSRSRAITLLDAGGVIVNNRRASRSDKGLVLSPGDRVELLTHGSDGASDFLSRIAPEVSPSIEIVKQGDGWVIVNKPCDTPVHPLRPGETGTVLNHLIAAFPSIAGIGEGGLRSGVVHRLDVEASGLLVVATTQTAWDTLRGAFREHRAKKVYHAVVASRLEGHGECEVDLYVARHRPALVRVLDSASPRGKRPPESAVRRCDLAWRSLHTGDHASLIEVHLGTGFLHQIRVTLAHLGHPVLGDHVYGNDESDTRLLLHACELSAGPADARVADPPEFKAFL